MLNNTELGLDVKREGVSLEEEIELLRRENRLLRDRYRRIHRRAQATEGSTLRLERLRSEIGSLLDQRFREGELKFIMYKNLYEEAVKQIIDLGVDDTVDGNEMHRTGHLKELILRMHRGQYKP